MCTRIKLMGVFCGDIGLLKHIYQYLRYEIYFLDIEYRRLGAKGSYLPL